MGETRVTLHLHGPKGDADLEMLVDTGSTMTKIPTSIARRIGISPQHNAEVELADGRVIERDVSEVAARLDRITRTIPLVIGPDGEQPLLGLTALEIFGLKVNSVTRKLEPTRFIEYDQKVRKTASFDSYFDRVENLTRIS